MSSKDFLQRFIFEKASIRGEYIYLHESYQTIVNQHSYPQPIRQLLGEALCVAGLLSAVIKFNGRLTVQFRGKGKLKLLLAQCNNDFQLRGLAKWHGNLSYEDLMTAFHQGVLVIMLDSGVNTNPYQGIVSWRGNSLVEAIEGYFKESEQLNTKIWLSVTEHSAAGLLLQVIPTADKDTNVMEKELADLKWEQMIKQTANVDPKDLLSADYENLLQKLYPSEEIRIFPSVSLEFNCSCSRERGEDAILLLGQEEADAELKDKQAIVVTCDFCNKEYMFDPVDVVKIFQDKDNPSSPTQLH